MVNEIPLTSEFANFQFQTTLELQVYGFSFAWNSRYERWSMSLFDGNDTPLVQGIVVMSGPIILSQYVYEGMPPGKIVFVDTSGEDIDPGRNDLGDRVRMFYITSDDESLQEAS